MKLCIASANNKGGVGKSTTAALLSAALATPAFRVAIVDMDKQGTCSAWAKAGGDKFAPLVVKATAATLTTVLGSIDAELVLIDCPPDAEAPETLAALDVADLLMVPATPSAPDYWSTDEMLIAAKLRKPDLACLIVLNMATPTNHSAEMESAYRQTWPVAKYTLGFRTAYREAAAYGVGLRQLGHAKAKAAVSELEAVAVEVLTTAMAAK